MKTQKTKNQERFEELYLLGEKNDKQLATALTRIMLDFVNADNNTTPIRNMLEYMTRGKRLESHRTQAIFEWVKTVGNFRVTGSKKGEKVTVRTKKGFEYGKEWMDSLKETPWHMTAREMQKAKPWANPFEQMKRNYAIGWLMGDISESELNDIFEPVITDSIIGFAKGNEKLQDQVVARMSALQEQGAAVH